MARISLFIRKLFVLLWIGHSLILVREREREVRNSCSSLACAWKKSTEHNAKERKWSRFNWEIEKQNVWWCVFADIVLSITMAFGMHPPPWDWNIFHSFNNKICKCMQMEFLVHSQIWSSRTILYILCLGRRIRGSHHTNVDLASLHHLW